jgi:hypothetical protein
MNALADACQARREDVMTAGLENFSDVAPAMCAAPGAMNKDEGCHLISKKPGAFHQYSTAS